MPICGGLGTGNPSALPGKGLPSTMKPQDIHFMRTQGRVRNFVLSEDEAIL